MTSQKHCSIATILGSGFGLYGYLPALLENRAQKIILPLRYQPRLLARPELASYYSSIEWVYDERAALQCADTVVIALRPADQFHWVMESLKHPNIERLLLEKPLAESPGKAKELFNCLMASRKTFRISYIFRYTAWARQLALNLAEDPTVSIKWCFQAHHFRNDLDTWKRYTASGGGAIRFYGIHLVALLAELGYRDVLSSHCGIERWEAVFSGPSLPLCEVIVDSNSDHSSFLVERKDWVFANLKDPLVQETNKGHLDYRVPLLVEACRFNGEESAREYAWYDATLDLWNLIENFQ